MVVLTNSIRTSKLLLEAFNAGVILSWTFYSQNSNEERRPDQGPTVTVLHRTKQFILHIGLKEKGVKGYLWKQTPNAQGNNGYHKAVSGWKGEERNTIYILNEYK